MSSGPIAEVGEIVHLGCMCETKVRCVCGATMGYADCQLPERLRCPGCGRTYERGEFEKLERAPVKRG